MHSRVFEKCDLLMQIGMCVNELMYVCVCVCEIEVRAPSSPVNRVEGDPSFSMFSHLQSGSPICTRRRC